MPAAVVAAPRDHGAGSSSPIMRRGRKMLEGDGRLMVRAGERAQHGSRAVLNEVDQGMCNGNSEGLWWLFGRDRFAAVR